ncbi:MAG TPA: sialidase family protein [Actinophytocola sp.]|uniref:sialidase family protein n=1 Tax=Actinophytocola sp. TaxID=1872138 RepID=UPI002E072C07|nr:sialidase family protein [Actinophytocola sp.]
MVSAGLAVPAVAQSEQPSQPLVNPSMRSNPPDRTIFRGAASLAGRPAVNAAGVFVIDATAAASSTGGNEPSIAINPANPNEIAITRFTFAWPNNADVLHSTDSGQTWTNRTSIPVPPGVSGTSGCPCDQTIDYGRDGTLYGTFLTSTSVVTGSTTDPTQASAWQWNGNPAQTTNGTHAQPDQPWLLVNRDPTTAGQDDVYVAYDHFAGNPDARVAVSYGAIPVDITADNIAGTESPLATNPGLRMANDPRNGTMYALYEQSTGNTQPKNVTYRLNRSTNGGATWTLNGNTDGLVVDTVNSDQAPGFKFGTVNALLGGVDHAAVDPTNGDVYVAYGQDVSGGNRLRLRRLTDNGSGGLTVGPAVNVSTSTDAALPSVAVTSDGTIGVLYDTFDGTTSTGFPIFTAHLAQSTDHGATFTDTVLQSFQSPATDNSDPRQRVLGDYHQLKSVGRNFYGVFSGNTSGVPAANPPIHAIYFQVTPPPPASTLTYTGPTTADFHDAFTASATLTAAGSPVTGATVNFALGAGTGTEACSAVTNGAGVAACTIIPQEPAGPTTLTVSFAGNDSAGPASITVPFTITREETTLVYTGPSRIANGTPAQLTALLREDGVVPIDGRTVSIAIGTGATQQTCTGTTNAAGTAACTITPNQPLNASATVPLTATFAGDAFYLPSSATAILLLQFMTGRAFGLTAAINLLLLRLRVPPTPDTGPVRTPNASTTNPPCTATLSALVLTAHALCANVTTTVNPGTATATATAADATIGVPGIPVISVSGLTATSTSNCTTAAGSTTLTLTIGGVPITVPATPNFRIGLAGGAQLIVNEQTPVPGADFGLTVNAIHLTALGGIVDVVVGSATSDLHNCI